MNNPHSELITFIVSYVTERGGSVTKTKLLKLLYLFDVEFYRTHRKTFTGFQWKYFHLGPWTKEFDPLLDNLVSSGSVDEKLIERPEFDAKFLRSNGPVDLKGAFDDFKDEAILRSVLDTWGASSTGEILDYVYFRTEPMEYGVRNEPLDFSRTSQQPPETYKRPSSGTTAGEIKKMRREFSESIAKRLQPTSFQFTPPQYDEEFRAAMEKLDAGIL